MGTGVTPSLWPPVLSSGSVKTYKPLSGRKSFYSENLNLEVMSAYGGSEGLTEKLEHSTILDLLQIGVYAYFGYIAYNNLGYGEGEILAVSANPTVIAVQLAGLLILINLMFMLHDRIKSSSRH